MEKCRICKINGTIGKTLFLGSTVKSRYGKTYYYFQCTSCNTKRVKKYLQTENGKKVKYKATKKYMCANPLRIIAHRKAQKIKKEVCRICGSLNIHRHHPDLEKPLEVIFLCPLHHKQIHRKMQNH